MNARRTPLMRPGQFFTAKRFATTLPLQGKHYEVEVQTPDLTDAPLSFWADWGPMYTCALGDKQTITVCYRCEETGLELRQQLCPSTIAVSSPARFARRQERPLYLEVVDPAHGLSVRAYMDADGIVRETELSTLPVNINLAEQLEREARLASAR